MTSRAMKGLFPVGISGKANWFNRYTQKCPAATTLTFSLRFAPFELRFAKPGKVTWSPIYCPQTSWLISNRVPYLPDDNKGTAPRSTSLILPSQQNWTQISRDKERSIPFQTKFSRLELTTASLRWRGQALLFPPWNLFVLISWVKKFSKLLRKLINFEM